MPTTPSQYAGRIMNKQELAQAIRADIIGEFDAIMQYEQHIMETDNEVAKTVWTDIRNEEMAHVGELMTLLAYIDPSEEIYFAQGQKEVEDMLRKMGKI